MNNERRFIHFVDGHDDDMEVLYEVTKEQFDLLSPYRADMANCNPLPDKLEDLLWADIYANGNEVDIELVDEIPEEQCLMQMMV